MEKRLKVTEERLHQERADRANNLSNVEDKLLTDNARLQVNIYFMLLVKKILKISNIDYLTNC